jgi:hypothetical protein
MGMAPFGCEATPKVAMAVVMPLTENDEEAVVMAFANADTRMPRPGHSLELLVGRRHRTRSGTVEGTQTRAQSTQCRGGKPVSFPPQRRAGPGRLGLWEWPRGSAARQSDSDERARPPRGCPTRPQPVAMDNRVLAGSRHRSLDTVASSSSGSAGLFLVLFPSSCFPPQRRAGPGRLGLWEWPRGSAARQSDIDEQARPPRGRPTSPQPVAMDNRVLAGSRHRSLDTVASSSSGSAGGTQTIAQSTQCRGGKPVSFPPQRRAGPGWLGLWEWPRGSAARQSDNDERARPPRGRPTSPQPVAMDNRVLAGSRHPSLDTVASSSSGSAGLLLLPLFPSSC